MLFLTENSSIENEYLLLYREGTLTATHLNEIRLNGLRILNINVLSGVLLPFAGTSPGAALVFLSKNQLKDN